MNDDKIHNFLKREFINKSPYLYIGNFDEVEFGKAVCAFANAQGGYVVCSLPEGASSDIKKQITIFLEERLVPHSPIFPLIKKSVNGDYLFVTVPEGLDKPYSYESTYYIYQNNSIKLISNNDISQMLADAATVPQRWERMLNGKITMDDFDRLEMQALHKISPWNDDEEFGIVMEKFNLQRLGMFTNAATILLCRYPGRIHPQTCVRAICCEKITDNVFKDAQIYDGPALQVIKDLLYFIERNTRNEMRFVKDSMQRINVPEYPQVAIREALVNAFAHRDYARYEGGIRVEILSDRISIWNAGSFPEGVSLKMLKQGHVSILRNPDIARYFYARGYMEMTGRGMKLITEECKHLGLPAPKWEFDSLGVTLTLFSRKKEEEKIIKPVFDQTLIPETKPRLDTETRFKTKTELDMLGRAEAKPRLDSETRPEIKTGLDTEASPEKKPELDTEARPEAKPGLDTEARPETIPINKLTYESSFDSPHVSTCNDSENYSKLASEPEPESGLSEEAEKDDTADNATADETAESDTSEGKSDVNDARGDYIGGDYTTDDVEECPVDRNDDSEIKTYSESEPAPEPEPTSASKSKPSPVSGAKSEPESLSNFIEHDSKSTPELTIQLYSIIEMTLFAYASQTISKYASQLFSEYAIKLISEYSSKLESQLNDFFIHEILPETLDRTNGDKLEKSMYLKSFYNFESKFLEIIKSSFLNKLDSKFLEDLKSSLFNNLDSKLLNRFDSNFLNYFDSQSGLTPIFIKLLHFIKENARSKKEIANYLSLKPISGELNKILDHLRKDLFFIEWTIPEHPTSRYQRYRLTEQGQAYLKNHDHNSSK